MKKRCTRPGCKAEYLGPDSERTECTLCGYPLANVPDDGKQSRPVVVFEPPEPPTPPKVTEIKPEPSLKEPERREDKSRPPRRRSSRLILIIIGAGVVVLAAFFVLWRSQHPAPASLPQVILRIRPEIVNKGESAELQWSATNAISVVITPGIGSEPPQGTVRVAPRQSTVYQILASNTAGAASSTVMLSVNPRRAKRPAAVAIITFGARPSVLTPGTSAMLTWDTRNASEVSIEPGVGTVGTSGSVTVHPQQSTDYTMMASGRGGPVTATAHIEVRLYPGTMPPPAVAPPPVATLNASRTTITRGQSITLSWTTAHATSATLTGVGSVALNGSAALVPQQTTTYTLAVSGTGGSTEAVAQVQVEAAPVPVATLSVNPAKITAGQTATLSWTTAHATTATLTGIGFVRPTGFVSVAPQQSATYTLSASGPGGSISATAYVRVISIPPPCAGPRSGTLIWRGDVVGTVLIDIEGNEASTGILTGSLPGSPVMLQPADPKRVRIVTAPLAENKWKRLVLQVRGKGKTTVSVTWTCE